MATKKGRENERKWRKMRKSGNAERFPPNLLMSKKLSLITVQELIYCPTKKNYKKKLKLKAFTRDKIGRKPKEEQKGKNSNGQ